MFVAACASNTDTVEGLKAKCICNPQWHRSISTWLGICIRFDRSECKEVFSKVLGVHGQNELNKNVQLLLEFAEDNKLALLTTVFLTSKSGTFSTFQSANRSRRRAPMDYIRTKQVDRR